MTFLKQLPSVAMLALIAAISAGITHVIYGHCAAESAPVDMDPIVGGERLSNLMHPSSGVFYQRTHLGFYEPKFTPDLQMASPLTFGSDVIGPSLSSMPMDFHGTSVLLHNDGDVVIETYLNTNLGDEHE